MYYNRNNVKLTLRSKIFSNTQQHGRIQIMMVSTKGRYALRVLIDLAEHQTDGYIPLKDTAAKEKFLYYIVISGLTILHEVGDGDAVQVFVDDFVETLPERESFTASHSGTVGAAGL